MACQFAKPDQKVISILGDGGFLFSAKELETAVREKLNLIHFIWCDKSYNMVQEQQHSAVHFGYVDMVKFAESFGAKGYKLAHSDDLIPTLTKAMKEKGVILIEVPIDYSDNKMLFTSLNEHAGN